MSRLSKLSYYYLQNILDDFAQGLMVGGKSYSYYLEGSLASILTLERKSSWCETNLFIDATEVNASLDINPSNLGKSSLYLNKKGNPDASIVLRPKPIFHGNCYLFDEFDHEIVPIYLANLQLDKFMIRRIEHQFSSLTNYSP